MYKKIATKRGEISITLIILVMVSLFFTSAYYSAIRVSYALDEIQSSLDIAGIATLKQAVNIRLLKDELYGLDLNNKMSHTGANAVLSNFASQIRSQYRGLITFNPDIITRFEILTQDVYFERSSWGTGSIGTRPQIVLETVMRITLNINRGHDYQRSLQSIFFSSKRGGNIQILSVGSTTDGRTELVIRSTVKSLYQ